MALVLRRFFSVARVAADAAAAPPQVAHMDHPAKQRAHCEKAVALQGARRSHHLHQASPRKLPLRQHHRRARGRRGAQLHRAEGLAESTPSDNRRRPQQPAD
ncbi:hypothetical protein PMKS-002582 [Pichia membranifaciens]|uniref:Uncharacterized protein n=1 Tax=Pichia membranifaciens TaxID=4926 RepID=A0A1Q2YHU2_9ASCO|nr:hypothetical protein PMKS-002582 [Pichia membranifaciens]